ncbi:energy transducer TonB [Litorimonas sp. RW-G-Af-16]
MQDQGPAPINEGQPENASRKAMRWSASAIFAGGVTTALTLSMAAMIATEFQPQDKLLAASFEINPVEQDIVVNDNRVEIEPYKKVQTPPPPPTVGNPETDKVTVPPIIMDGDSNVFDTKPIKMAMVTSINMERDYQPLVRIPPTMPMRATKSGHCNVVFDVSPEGKPFNVRASYCSQSMFERPAIKSVQNWQYNPQMVDGRAVTVNDIQTKISFRLVDERNQIIPE